MSLTTGLLYNSYRVLTGFVCVVIFDSKPARGGQCLFIWGQLVRKGHLLIFLLFPPHMVDVCMRAIDSRDAGSPGGVRGGFGISSKLSLLEEQPLSRVGHLSGTLGGSLS